MNIKSHFGSKSLKTTNKTIKRIAKPVLNPLACSEPTEKTTRFLYCQFVRTANIKETFLFKIKFWAESSVFH